VWRGSTGGFGGLAKGRAALLNLGMERPDLIDSGVLDWDAVRWGEDKGRLKAKMSFGEQARALSFAVLAIRSCISKTLLSLQCHGLWPWASCMCVHLLRPLHPSSGTDFVHGAYILS
jgi:hypothetical protein